MATPELTLYYDGNCVFCRTEMARLHVCAGKHPLR